MKDKAEEEFIHYVLKGNTHAIDLCNMLYETCQTWDDLIDKDKPISDAQINSVFRCLLVSIPMNPFYQNFMHILSPQFSMIIDDWLDSNELEKEADPEGKYLSFVLRESVAGILIQCSRLVGGDAWARSVSVKIRKRNMDGSFEEYIANIGSRKGGAS